MVDRPIAEAKIRIRVDDSGFREELRADITAATSGQKATVRVDADTGRARSDIDEAARDRGSTIKVHADTSAANASLGSLKGNLIALGAITSAPLGATALGGIIGLGAGAGVAATGIGAFAAGAIPSIKGVISAQHTLTQEQQAYNLAVAEGNKSGARDALLREQQTLQGLTAQQRAALGPLHELSAAYKTFGQAVAPQALGFFTEALHTATSLLPAITPLAKAAGGALGGLFHQLDAGAKSPAFAAFIHQMSVEAPPVITAFGHIIGNLGLALGHTFTSAAPLITGVLHGLEGATGALARFTDSGGFRSFVAYAVQEGPVVAHDFAELAGAIIKISAALAPVGDAVLHAIGPIAHLAGDLAPIAPAIAAIWLGARGFTILSAATSAIQVFAGRAIAGFGSVASAAVADAATAQAAWAGVLGALAGVAAGGAYLVTGGLVRAAAGSIHDHIPTTSDTAAVQSLLANQPASVQRLFGDVGKQDNLLRQTGSSNLDTAVERQKAAAKAAAGVRAAAAAAARQAAADPQQQHLNDLLNGIGIPGPTGGSGRTVITPAQAAANAAVFGDSVTSALTAAVAKGRPALEAEFDRIRQKVLSTLTKPDQAAQRHSLLDYVREQVNGLEQSATRMHTFTTTLTSLKTQLGTVQGQLTTAQSAATSFHSSLVSALTVNVSGALSAGYQGAAIPIGTYLTQQLGQLQTFQGLLGQVKAAGASSALVAQLAQLGPTGNKAIQQLLSSGGVGSASSLLDQINAITSTIADQTTQTIYSPQLDALNQQVVALKQQQATTNAKLDALIKAVGGTARQTGTTVAQGLTGVGRSGVRSGKAPTSRKQHKITTRG